MQPVDALAGELRGMPDRATYLRIAGHVLMSVVPCDLVGWNAIDVEAGVAEVVAYPTEALDHDAGPEVLAVVDDHPMVQSYAIERSSGLLPQPRRISDLVSQLEYHRTRAYQLLLRPLEVERQLTVAAIPLGAAGHRAWALNRSGSDFSDDEVSLLRQLQPMLRLLDLAYSAELARSAPTGPANALSERELEVLRLCGSGLTTRAIGRILGIQPRTVSKHLEHAYRKLGCNNRVSALAIIGVLPPVPPRDE